MTELTRNPGKSRYHKDLLLLKNQANTLISNVEWLDMASAPLYERILLIYRARNLIVCGRWEEDKWRSRSAPKPFWTNDKVGTIGIVRLREEPPDGWMPLPVVQI